MKKWGMTKHAMFRIIQRKIPEVLVQEAISSGQKVFLPDRQSVEYRLKHVLGLRGTDLVVVTGKDGAVITSYVEKNPRFKR